MRRLRHRVILSLLVISLAVALPAAAAPTAEAWSTMHWLEERVSAFVDGITALVSAAGSSDASGTASPPPVSPSTNSGDQDTGPDMDPDG
jgi:hypothetical protein